MRNEHVHPIFARILNASAPHVGECSECGGNGSNERPYQLACSARHPGPFFERGYFQKTVRLDVLDIHAWKDECDPTRTPWRACLGEYDEGTRVFSGATQREAVDELLDYYEQDNGELHA